MSAVVCVGTAGRQTQQRECPEWESSPSLGATRTTGSPSPPVGSTATTHQQAEAQMDRQTVCKGGSTYMYRHPRHGRYLAQT